MTSLGQLDQGPDIEIASKYRTDAAGHRRLWEGVAYFAQAFERNDGLVVKCLAETVGRLPGISLLYFSALPLLTFRSAP